MSIGKLGLATAVAAGLSSGVLAQEDNRTDHIDTEYGLIDYNACKIGSIIGDSNLCLEHGPDHDSNNDERVFTKDGQPVEISYNEYLGSLQLGDFEYLRPEEDSNSHTLINGNTGEKVVVELKEGDRIIEIVGSHILIRPKGEYNGRKVIDLQGEEIFSSEDIFMKGENGFTEVDISSLSDSQFDMLIKTIANGYSVRNVDTSDLDYSVAQETFFNYSDKNDIIRLLWYNKEAILERKEFFSEYIGPLIAVRDNFDAIEAIVGRLDGKALLEADDVGYTQDFREEYLEEFRKIPGLLEAFGYQEPEVSISNSDNSVFGETEKAQENNDLNHSAEVHRVVRSIQFMYRRLENPVTNLMIEWYLDNSITAENISEETE